MSTRRGWTILGGAAGLFLLVLSGLVGMAVDRMRFEPRRAAILAHFEAVIRANQQGTPLAIRSCRSDGSVVMNRWCQRVAAQRP